MTQTTIIRSIGGLVFDAVIRESHRSTLEITDNPVETGITISDHAFMTPLSLTIEAGVSDTPLRQRDDDKFQSDAGRARRAFELLTDLQKKAEPFSVVTGLKLYKNMLCTTLSVDQDKDTANVLNFTAELREVIIVSTRIVTYPPRKAGTTARQASQKKEGGQKQGKEVTKPEEQKKVKKTVLKSIFG